MLFRERSPCHWRGLRAPQTPQHGFLYVQNTKICCAVFRTGFRSSDRRRYLDLCYETWQ